MPTSSTSGSTATFVAAVLAVFIFLFVAFLAGGGDGLLRPDRRVTTIVIRFFSFDQ